MAVVVVEVVLDSLKGICTPKAFDEGPWGDGHVMSGVNRAVHRFIRRSRSTSLTILVVYCLLYVYSM